MALDSAQYAIPSLTTTSQEVVLRQDNVGATRVIIDNTAGSTPAFVTAGPSTMTAVFPTSLTAPLDGAVVGAGTVQTYMCRPTDKFFAAVRSSGTADLYMKFGSGE
jgi:hypothetical protein